MSSANSAANSAMPAYLKQLVAKGSIANEIAVQSFQQATDNNINLLEYLVRKKIVAASQLAFEIAIQYGMSFVDLKSIEIDREINKYLSPEQERRWGIAALFVLGNKVVIGIADPANLKNLDEAMFATGNEFEAVIVEYDKLQDHLHGDESEFGGESAFNVGLQVSDDEVSQSIKLNTASIQLKKSNSDGSEMVRFIDEMLAHAIRLKVSDIHIEPYEKVLRIRYRIDGVLTVVATPPVESGMQMVSRMKVMAKMDISERRIPQDGRIRFMLDGKKKIDFRVNTLPTVYGEKVVLRILDSASATLGIDQLGFEPAQREALMSALKKPDGMLLVTGPTGSGKTVTLYTGLGILNTPDRNVSTAEDPAEINMPGVNQVNVNPKAGLTFASALRAFLRQDPDIIMVGEIRDLETAEISIKAAQTGHMVLSTLHTNSAPETLTRLLNMGIPAFNLASTVNLIVAQRLGRRLCEKCKVPMEEIPSEALESLGLSQEEVTEGIFDAVGCPHCVGGYKGRVGIYQVMPISDAIARMLMKGANAIEISDQAEKEGIWDLKRSGIEKIKQGVTSIAEIQRVIKD